MLAARKVAAELRAGPGCDPSPSHESFGRCHARAKAPLAKQQKARLNSLAKNNQNDDHFCVY